MAHEFQSFYDSKQWHDCRKAYWRYKHGLCENCLKKGIYRPAKVVHHKVHVTAETVDNPQVTLSFDNLQLLCQDCHAEAHRNLGHRFVCDDDGNILTAPVR